MGGAWTQVGADIDGEAPDDLFGNSVSIAADGKRVAIGAYLNDGNGSNKNAGQVKIYKELGGEWTQVGTDIDGEAISDQSGISVSISADGTRVAIGANGNDDTGSNAGHSRVYQLSTPPPVKLIRLKVQAKNKKSLLEWSTVSEDNNKGFEIEHSTDSRNWERIDFVSGLSLIHI